MKYTKLNLRALFCLAAAILFFSPAVHAENRNPPPRLSLVRLGKGGSHLEIGFHVVESQYDRVRDRPIQANVIRYSSHKWEHVEFRDLAGKPIDSMIARKRIEQETPVILVMLDEGKKKQWFDEAYLPAFSPETMVVLVTFDEENFDKPLSE